MWSAVYFGGIFVSVTLLLVPTMTFDVYSIEPLTCWLHCTEPSPMLGQNHDLLGLFGENHDLCGMFGQSCELYDLFGLSHDLFGDPHLGCGLY